MHLLLAHPQVSNSHAALLLTQLRVQGSAVERLGAMKTQLAAKIAEAGEQSTQGRPHVQTHSEIGLPVSHGDAAVRSDS